MSILAYHLIWTTYGTWLPGDQRGWIKKRALGVQQPSPNREATARALMAEEAVILSAEQRRLVEQTIHDHCQLRGWQLHALNARTNHIHALVTALVPAEEVMKQLKAWCSRKLSDAAGLHDPVARKAGRRRWFTEGGDQNLIDSEEYFNNTLAYVIEGQ